MMKSNLETGSEQECGMKCRALKYSILILVIFVMFTGFQPTANASAGSEGTVNVGYLYSLSDFTQTVPLSWPKIALDNVNKESILLYQNRFRIFNKTGMEIYRFGDSMNAYITDITTNGEGRIVGLSAGKSSFGIIWFDFFGKIMANTALQGLPTEFDGFRPNRIVWKNGFLYLAETLGLKVAVFDEECNFRHGYDLIDLLEMEEKERDSTEMMGFNVDNDGAILFTIAVHFSAYRVLPDGSVESFGQKGSTPGKFGIVAGIDRDSRGNYLVSDLLRNVIMIFDNDFNFITEFGYYGSEPGNLVRPSQIAIDQGRNRIYVTQGRRLGVSVFRLDYD